LHNDRSMKHYSALDFKIDHSTMSVGHFIIDILTIYF
jgi:hypothetical protein